MKIIFQDNKGKELNSYTLDEAEEKALNAVRPDIAAYVIDFVKASTESAINQLSAKYTQPVTLADKKAVILAKLI